VCCHRAECMWLVREVRNSNSGGAENHLQGRVRRSPTAVRRAAGRPLMVFVLARFVADCIAASDPADVEGSVERLRGVYKEQVQHCTADVRLAVPNEGPDEVLLHESNMCTIYIVRVPAGIRYAPHDHGMVAFVGVFDGVEVNDYFSRSAADSISIPSTSTISVHPGEVALLDADVVHAISSEGSSRSQALHVYLGNLGATARQLFNPKTGSAMEFTMENYFGHAEPPQPVPVAHDQAVYPEE
jgi:predicted metal-dependent enzyme (double-stranded beta helix superfamily)